MATRLYTVKEAAVLMSVHPQTVYRLIWGNELPFVNLAKPGQRPRLRISEKAIDEWVAPRESLARAA